ncbi:MAG: hypothetical protein ABH919_01825 [bacterium]
MNKKGKTGKGKKESGLSFYEWQEESPVKVGGWLLREGFYIAGNDRMALDSLEKIGHSCINILQDNPEAKTENFFSKILFWFVPFFRPKQRKIFVGTIWLDTHEGTNKKNWVFNVYGRENFKKWTPLAKKLSEDFNIKITLRLVGEKQLLENFATDFSTEY